MKLKELNILQDIELKWIWATIDDLDKISKAFTSLLVKEVSVYDKYKTDKRVFTNKVELAIIEKRQMVDEKGKKIYTNQDWAKAIVMEGLQDEDIKILQQEAERRLIKNTIESIRERINFIKLCLKIKDYDMAQWYDLISK